MTNANVPTPNSVRPQLASIQSHVLEAIRRGDKLTDTHIYKLMILREEDGEVVDPHIQVHIPDLPQQQGVADCGVYAIAYAFHAARGDSLEDIEFEQDKMRQHLARCLTKQKLTPFPHSQRRAHVPPYPWFPYQEIEVFCTCEMPECLDNMIQCDGCEE